jgi:hypothetical protein
MLNDSTLSMRLLYTIGCQQSTINCQNTDNWGENAYFLFQPPQFLYEKICRHFCLIDFCSFFATTTELDLYSET